MQKVFVFRSKLAVLLNNFNFVSAGSDAQALEKISIEQLSRLGEVSRMKLDIRQSDRKRRKREVSGILSKYTIPLAHSLAGFYRVIVLYLIKKFSLSSFLVVKMHIVRYFVWLLSGNHAYLILTCRYNTRHILRHIFNEIKCV